MNWIPQIETTNSSPYMKHSGWKIHNDCLPAWSYLTRSYFMVPAKTLCKYPTKKQDQSHGWQLKTAQMDGPITKSRDVIWQPIFYQWWCIASGFFGWFLGVCAARVPVASAAPKEKSLAARCTLALWVTTNNHHRWMNDGECDAVHGMVSIHRGYWP